MCRKGGGGAGKENGLIREGKKGPTRGRGVFSGDGGKEGTYRPLYHPRLFRSKKKKRGNDKGKKGKRDKNYKRCSVHSELFNFEGKFQVKAKIM